MMNILQTMNQSKTYNCLYCNRDYREKFNYDRHIGFCEFSHKSQKEQDNEIDAFEKVPGMYELFAYIKELSVRVGKLEKENTVLKQQLNIEKKKVDIGVWLNSLPNKPSITFTKWILDIPYHKYLNHIFMKDMEYAIQSCLEKGSNDISINDKEFSPIYATNQKKNMFYVYDEIQIDGKKMPQWCLITGKDMDKWLNYISQALLIEFKKWCDEHQREINNNDDMNQKYISNFKKIIGSCKNADEIRNHNIRKYLFNKIKET